MLFKTKINIVGKYQLGVGWRGVWSGKVLSIVERRLRRVRGSVLVEKLGGGRGILQGKEKRVFWFYVFPLTLHTGHPANSESSLKPGFGDPD